MAYTSIFARDWFSLYFDKGVGIRYRDRATGIKIKHEYKRGIEPKKKY